MANVPGLTTSEAAGESPLPWLHSLGQPTTPQRVVDINKAPRKTLLAMGLSRSASERLLSVRRQYTLLNASDAAKLAKLSQRDRQLLETIGHGAAPDEVIVKEASFDGGRVMSDKPWSVAIEFVPPVGGLVEVVSLNVLWCGETFTVQRKLSSEESECGQTLVELSQRHGLPTGPIEVHVTLYDSLGGACTRVLSTWVLPSNPFSMLLSPGDRSIRNGSIRPDWVGGNWRTRVTLTLVNGDGTNVTLPGTCRWKFWDGGVGGTLIESGTVNFGSFVVPAFSTRTRSITFTSPPNSGVFNTYENEEDMTLELELLRTGNSDVERTITCRIMGGWGVNIIHVGDYSSAERSTISAGVFDARDLFENHGLTFSSIQWWEISNAQAGGYRFIADEDEADDLVDDWTVDNDSVDCFVVRAMYGSTAGLSLAPGPTSKDDACDFDGVVITMSTVCLAHELGHYIGGQPHADTLGTGNLMHSICGGRSLTYDQYKDFFDHGWLRIVR